jgi:hypothetical protein
MTLPVVFDRILSSTGAVEIFSAAPLVKRPKPKGRASPGSKSGKVPNPYFIFCARRRAELHAENPELPSREVTKMLAAEWAQLSAAKKAEYTALYQERFDRGEAEESIETPQNKILIKIPLPDGTVLAVPAYFATGSNK